MAKKKQQTKPKAPTISLGEFAQLEGVKETLVAGFKVWLKNDLRTRSRPEWKKLLNQYLRS